MNSIALQALPPLSLYIHIPWCARKCPYCDFNSHASEQQLPEREYVDAVLQDLEHALDAIQGRSLVSIFFGGGTPSLFSPAAIAALLNAVRQRVPWREDIEITLEANPGTVDEEHFAGFRQAGINRLSLGIQSFDDGFLQALGRIHSADEAIRAVEGARAAGFDDINLDLMYGLPGQDAGQATADLQQALALAPSHLSWYELTVEPNTAFYSQAPRLPDETEMERIEAAGHALLERSGFERYEISAYARPARQSAHNCNYWQFGDYLGLGAGAHSKISRLRDNTINRQWKTRVPTDYIKAGSDKVAGRRELTPQTLPLEFMMNALRLQRGVERELYGARTGTDIGDIEETLEQLRGQGLLATEPGRVCTTARGFQYLNTVLQAFMVKRPGPQ